MTNYDVYVFTTAEYIRTVTEGLIITAFISFLFYEKLLTILLLCPIVVYYVKNKRKALCNKRKKELKLQFREMCISLSSALSTGHSLVNAVNYSSVEMEKMYGSKSYISKEMEHICIRLKMNIPVETVYSEFAKRTDIEEINIFADILNIAQRSGGDIIGIMKSTADNIGEKVDVEREIISIINSKKYEQQIMNLVPLFIIIYMKIMSPDILRIMYDTIMGNIVMTICLVVYALTYYFGGLITRIEV